MRRAALIGGLALLALIWFGPLLSVWRESFSAHMLAHMGVVALAAPMIAIGMSENPRRIPAGMPLLASIVELVVVWAWHSPALRALAEASVAATILEQGMFLATGLPLWISCLHQAAGDTRAPAVGAVGLLFTSIHMTLLGALLSLSPRLLYGQGDVTCLGIRLSAEQDQALGGVLMLLIGAVVYLAGGLALLARLLREPSSSAQGGRC